MLPLLLLTLAGCAHPVPPTSEPSTAPVVAPPIATPEVPPPPPECPAGHERSCACTGMEMLDDTVCPCITPAMIAKCMEHPPG
jgi:hypothetical protein